MGHRIDSVLNLFDWIDRLGIKGPNDIGVEGAFELGQRLKSSGGMNRRRNHSRPHRRTSQGC